MQIASEPKRSQIVWAQRLWTLSLTVLETSGNIFKLLQTHSISNNQYDSVWYTGYCNISCDALKLPYPSETWRTICTPASNLLRPRNTNASCNWATTSQHLIVLLHSNNSHGASLPSWLARQGDRWPVFFAVLGWGNEIDEMKQPTRPTSLSAVSQQHTLQVWCLHALQALQVYIVNLSNIYGDSQRTGWCL